MRNPDRVDPVFPIHTQGSAPSAAQPWALLRDPFGVKTQAGRAFGPDDRSSMGTATPVVLPVFLRRNGNLPGTDACRLKSRLVPLAEQAISFSQCSHSPKHWLRKGPRSQWHHDGMTQLGKHSVSTGVVVLQKKCDDSYDWRDPH